MEEIYAILDEVKFYMSIDSDLSPAVTNPLAALEMAVRALAQRVERIDNP